MARPLERCIGQTGGDRCTVHSTSLQNHLCMLHQNQHYDPARNSHLHCPDARLVQNHTFHAEGQQNPSQAGALTRQGSMITQSGASPSIQLPTFPEQPHLGRRATFEPSGPVPFQPFTPTEASNAVRDESPRNFFPNVSTPSTPAQLALLRISESIARSDENRIHGYTTGAGGSRVREICGWMQLLRTACGDGDQAVRLRERLRRWLGRGETVDDEIVRSLDRVMNWE